MVTKLPVAEESHPLLPANLIAAEPVRMTVQKEAMVVNHRAKKENTNQEKVRGIQTIALKAVSAAARRKALNQGALLIQVARPMMISQSVALVVSHPAKNDLILKRLPIRAGQVLMTVLKEALTASHQARKENSNQEAHHIRAVQVLMISLKEVLTANHPAEKEILNREDRHIQADQHPMTGPGEVLTANHPAKKENSNQEAHHILAVRVLTTNRKEVLVVIRNSAVHLRIAADLKNGARIRLSANRKIHLIINQNQSAALKNG